MELAKDTNKVTRTLHLQNVVKFLTSVFVFFLMVDPANVIFKIKIPLFALLLIVCFVQYRQVWKPSVVIIISLYVVLISTFLIGNIAGFKIETSFSVYMFQSFLMLFLLMYIPHLNLLEKLKIPAIILFVVVASIYIIMWMFPEFEVLIYGTLTYNYKGTVMMARRNFIGFDFTNVYYNSVTVLIIPMGVYLSNFLKKTGSRKKNFLLFLMIFLSLIMGGTRAALLASVGCAGIVYLIYLSRSRVGSIFSFFAIIIMVIVGIGIVMLLLGDKDESSNAIKQNLIASFINLISEHPSVLLFGQGVGALFETQARGIIVQSEWSYLELVRWFGIPGGMTILAIYLYPVLLILKNRSILPYASSIIIGYVFYLFIAGTNPLLFSSNGFLALLIMYSYALNVKYRVIDEKQYPVGNSII